MEDGGWRMEDGILKTQLKRRGKKYIDFSGATS
jgi:hypothetical protein